eukprot:jgi/Phyca11/109325/e_gw1.16.530.1
MVAEIAVGSNILLSTECNTVEKTTAVSTINTSALQQEISALIQFSTSAYANAPPIHLPVQCRAPPVLELQLEQPSPTETELASTVPVRRSSRAKRLPKRSLPAYSARPRQSKKRRKTKKVDQAPGKWRVAFIKDRVTTSTGQILYRVLWKSKKHGRLPRTWEPRDMLLHDGFGEELAVVDEWVDGGRKQDFFQFVSELYPSVAGANPTGTCLFLALQHALLLAGEPFGVQDSHIQEFISRSDELQQDLSRGVPWSIFRAFILQVHIAGSRLSMCDIEMNRHCSGHRGVQAITRLKLEDGIYLVAASNTMTVGHAFVLQVRGAQKTVHDDTTKCSLASYGEWINRVMFVRKVVLDE